MSGWRVIWPTVQTSGRGSDWSLNYVCILWRVKIFVTFRKMEVGDASDSPSAKKMHQLMAISGIKTATFAAADKTNDWFPPPQLQQLQQPLNTANRPVVRFWICGSCAERAGRVTMTTESCKNGATTLFRMNFSGYIGHVTLFSWMLTTAYCLVVGLKLGLWLWLVLDLVSDWLHVFILLSVVIVPYQKRRGVGQSHVACILGRRQGVMSTVRFSSSSWLIIISNAPTTS